ncbi:hypothetical protein TSUD_105590, partial [Trifolium subterraneum]
MEEFLASRVKEIMKTNSCDFFVPKVAEIEAKMKSGYYSSHGLSSVKEDISRMCRDAMKLKNRSDASDVNHLITLFLQLTTQLEANEKSDSDTTTESESDHEVRSQIMVRKPRGDVCFSPEEELDFITDDREWGARMTKASLVPPVTRKYEVIDHYCIVADEEEVQRKMRVSLPDDYAEKLSAQKNGTEESDMELPEVKSFKPRKQLGNEVIEQEVYGIDPYTHNLLLDSMPEELDWSLQEKHLFIEDMLLRTLNTHVRSSTGTGNTPMSYPLQPVIDDIKRCAEESCDTRMIRMCQGILKAIDSRPDDKYVAYRKGLGVVCNKEEGFSQDDFVVEFLGE